MTKTKQTKTVVCDDQAKWDAKIGVVNDELSEITISCHECMFEEYSFEQIITALQEVQAKQGEFLHNHCMEGGSVDSATGTITILVPHEECRKQFAGYVFAFDVLNAALQLHLDSMPDEEANPADSHETCSVYTETITFKDGSSSTTRERYWTQDGKRVASEEKGKA